MRSRLKKTGPIFVGSDENAEKFSPQHTIFCYDYYLLNVLNLTL